MRVARFQSRTDIFTCLYKVACVVFFLEAGCRTAVHLRKRAVWTNKLADQANFCNLRTGIQRDSRDLSVNSQFSTSGPIVPGTAPPWGGPGYVKNLSGTSRVWHGSLLITLPVPLGGRRCHKAALFISSSSIREGQFQPGWAHAWATRVFLSGCCRGGGGRWGERCDRSQRGVSWSVEQLVRSLMGRVAVGGGREVIHNP